mgnify:CR=1 FL=1
MNRALAAATGFYGTARDLVTYWSAHLLGDDIGRLSWGRDGYVNPAFAAGLDIATLPGLIAAIIAQLLMGRASASPYQTAGRSGHLERRIALPLSAALRMDQAAREHLISVVGRYCKPVQ